MPEAYHNYQRDLSYIIRWNQRKGNVPTLLMHACCGPCSTYCIEYLSQFFKITIFYYNPNIAPSEEYAHRVAEIRRFVSEFKTKYPVEFIEGEYDPKKFYDIARGLEDEKEGGKRCRKCFELRLAASALNCDSAKRQGSRRKWDSTILPPRSPSAPRRTSRC